MRPKYYVAKRNGLWGVWGNKGAAHAFIWARTLNRAINRLEQRIRRRENRL